jgi:spore germination cell wall hydrolase CwlJ-like protein
MVASRARLLGTWCSARFWFTACSLALMPTSVGYQELAGLLARQPGAQQHTGEHMLASPFGSVETATFSYGRPIGTSMPAPPLYQMVSFDPAATEARGWEIDAPLAARTATPVDYPTVNRRLKGDRLPVFKAAPAPNVPESLPQLQPVDAPVPTPPVHPVPPTPAMPAAGPLKNSQHQERTPPAPPPILPLATAAADDVPPLAQPAQLPPQMPVLQLADIMPDGEAGAAPIPPDGDQDAAVAQQAAPDNAQAASGSDADATDENADGPVAADSEPAPALTTLSFMADDAADDRAQTFFGAISMGTPAGLESWAPGAEPIPALASAPAYKLASLESSDAAPDSAGETAANKDDAALLQSPAERLQLSGRPRARAEKCLADAVYFEARGEPRKGQEAVAQVVMNRVFSGYYPKDVCGVVFQNANRHLACQFTFACEGKDLNRIDEPDMWEQANEIAKDTLDGKIWLPDIAHATHYHAYWVHPSWVHEMTRVLKLGVHTFYRPRAWGDGDDEPVWGKGADKADAGKPADSAKGPQAVASPPPSATAHIAKL